jgi:hypothetical protein
VPIASRIQRLAPAPSTSTRECFGLRRQLEDRNGLVHAGRIR